MIREDTLSRIGISLPKGLLSRFDETLDCRGYSCRSEGIRDAIRTYIINYQWLSGGMAARKGVMTVVYKSTAPNNISPISEIRHTYKNIIRMSLFQSIQRDRHLEVLLVQGTGTQLKELADLVGLQKGIEFVKITTTTI